MSSPTVQLTFTLRTSPNVRTVHLLGSWDNYKSQLPLSISKDPGAKAGAWKGTFRFQGSHALKLGSRYWYYYIVDGYHCSHDPNKESVTEKTTGRQLNILDVPGGNGGGGTTRTAERVRPAVQTSNLPSSRHSREVPTGRALSPGKIQHPKPSKPYASRHLREADYETSPIDDLEERFAGTRISSAGSGNRHGPGNGKYSSSPSDLSDDSYSSGTAFSRSSPSGQSSMSSASDQSCRCERYGVTRSGQRVKLDCGGKRCGYSGSSSECSSEGSESSSDSEEDRRYAGRKVEVRKPASASKGGSGGGVGAGRHQAPQRPDVKRDERRNAYVIERRPRR